MHTIYHMVTLKQTDMKKVLQTVSTVEGFRSWWTTGTRQREDGTFEFHFTPEYHKEFKKDFVKERAARFTCTSGHPEWMGTSIDFQLEEGENGAINLHFRHIGWKEQSPMYGICSYHWALYLKSLESCLASGKGQPAEHAL